MYNGNISTNNVNHQPQPQHLPVCANRRGFPFSFISLPSPHLSHSPPPPPAACEIAAAVAVIPGAVLSIFGVTANTECSSACSTAPTNSSSSYSAVGAEIVERPNCYDTFEGKLETEQLAPQSLLLPPPPLSQFTEQPPHHHVLTKAHHGATPNPQIQHRHHLQHPYS